MTFVLFLLQGIDLRSSSPFFRSLSIRSNTGKWSFVLKLVYGFCSKSFGINIIALKQTSFVGESWSHSFINLAVSFIYFYLAEPAGKKRFLRQKTILSYIVFIISNEVALPEYDHAYIVAWCSVIPWSLFVLSELSFWLFVDSLSLHFVWCFFNPDVV